MVYTTMALAREGRRGRAVAWEGPEPAVEAANKEHIYSEYVRFLAL